MDVGQTWALIFVSLFAAFGFVGVAWWAVGVHFRAVRLEDRVKHLEREHEQARRRSSTF